VPCGAQRIDWWREVKQHTGRSLSRHGRRWEKISMAPGVTGILWQTHGLFATWRGNYCFFTGSRDFQNSGPNIPFLSWLTRLSIN
jgi:hypothetical protein